ncbi:hypothetical protein G7046_g7448 [Stylonectria norvegica]|nr:hypothetical protein G7046_g7448 [Stylonectria norvegica]
MSLGVKSLWRARSRCLVTAGLPLVSRLPRPSASGVPRPFGLITTLRFESTLSTTAPSPADTDSNPALPLVEPSVTLSPSLQRRRFYPGAAPPSKTPTKDASDEPKIPRNRMYKDAFRISKDEFRKRLAQNTFKPFVTPMRKYPTTNGTKASRLEHQRDVKTQMGHDVIWGHFDKAVPLWQHCFHLMKRMTPQWSDKQSMSAVRIVLPKSLDIEVNNQNLEYVDSATGVLQKLRAAVDKNPSAIILRGKSAVLAKAADEIIQFCNETKVYELGEVESADYKTKQLWPAIEGAANGGAALPEGKTENIWVHREYQSHFITTRYEDIPRPEVWTRDNFETFVTSLVYGRIPSHMAIPLYGTDEAHGRHIDTDGIRIDLIAQAFNDETARPFITAPVLKMAISLMAFKAGHRAEANRLIQLAEELGVPMDTDIFNVMLAGYVENSDVSFFYRFLSRMESRFFHPDIRTWLLFLQLSKGDDERRQIIVAMYDLGMFNHNATRRGIAQVMASHDSYTALKAGKSLSAFLKDQEERYGKDWCTAETTNSIIIELLRFHRKEASHIDDCKTLVNREIEAGRKIELSTIKTCLAQAVDIQNWPFALYALSLLEEAGYEADQAVYTSLVALSIKAHSMHALTTIYLYGTLNRLLKKEARQNISRVLLQTIPDPFWRRFPPNILPWSMAKDLKATKIRSPKSIMSAMDRTILSRWGDFTAHKTLSSAIRLALSHHDQPFHQQIKSGKIVGIRCLSIKLRRIDGQPGAVLVKPDAHFEPETMIENWQGSGGEEFAQVEEKGEDSATEQKIRHKIANQLEFEFDIDTQKEVEDKAGDVLIVPDKNGAALDETETSVGAKATPSTERPVEQRYMKKGIPTILQYKKQPNRGTTRKAEAKRAPSTTTEAVVQDEMTEESEPKLW